mgnify:CR=1 FL=1
MISMCEMLKKRECRAVKKYIFDENLYTLPINYCCPQHNTHFVILLQHNPLIYNKNTIIDIHKNIIFKTNI